MQKYTQCKKKTAGTDQWRNQRYRSQSGCCEAPLSYLMRTSYQCKGTRITEQHMLEFRGHDRLIMPFQVSVCCQYNRDNRVLLGRLSYCVGLLKVLVILLFSNYLRIYTYEQVYIYMYIYIYKYNYIYTYIYIYVCMCV